MQKCWAHLLRKSIRICLLDPENKKFEVLRDGLFEIFRSAKKLNDQLNKHIRMLEQALMNERKKKTAAAGEEQAATKDKDSNGNKDGLNSTKRTSSNSNSNL